MSSSSKKAYRSAHFHDTLMLLKKFRDVSWSVEISSKSLHDEIYAECGCSPDVLLDGLNITNSGPRLEGYARSLARSKKMLQILTYAIDVMRSRHKNGELYYWVLYYTYLSPQAESLPNILNLLNEKYSMMSSRTYYLRRAEAIEVLSSLLWGYTSSDCEDILDLLIPEAK